MGDGIHRNLPYQTNPFHVAVRMVEVGLPTGSAARRSGLVTQRCRLEPRSCLANPTVPPRRGDHRGVYVPSTALAGRKIDPLSAPPCRGRDFTRDAKHVRPAIVAERSLSPRGPAATPKRRVRHPAPTPAAHRGCTARRSMLCSRHLVQRRLIRPFYRRELDLCSNAHAIRIRSVSNT
jgi:hypothetical protein